MIDTRKIEKMNKNLQRVVGEIIHHEADLPLDVLVTVSRVEVTPNRRGAEVFLYIYPLPQAEQVVEHLRGQLYELQSVLNRRLDARVVPRIRFTVDYGAAHAAKIAERLDELKSTEAADAGPEEPGHA